MPHIASPVLCCRAAVPLYWDDFRSLDRSVWTHDLGDGSDLGIPGWGNVELQCYTDSPENIAIIPNPDNPADGVLRIRTVFSGAPRPCSNRATLPSQKTWTSGRITTRGSRTFTPVGTGTGCGPIRLEARMKMPGRSGHWAGFWALGAQGSWPAAGEIDIVEHVHNDPIFYGNIHFANSSGQREQQPQDPLHKLPVAHPIDWNVYRVDWGCDHIAWFLNGVQLRRVEKSQVSGWVFDGPFYLILNLAVGGNLPGNNVDPAGGELLVDWVNVTAPPAVPAASG